MPYFNLYDARVRQILKLATFRILVLIALTAVGCSESELIEVEEETQYVSDIDGNEYVVVTIGDQTWMAQNLRTTHYGNGDPISHFPDTTSWKIAQEGAWCWANNTEQYDSLYGKLYNWFATVDTRNICPQGWHVPTLYDWFVLTRTIDPYSEGEENLYDFSFGLLSDTAGGQLKDGGLYWYGTTEPNVDVSGFNALPVSGRYYDGTFNWASTIGFYTSFWSSDSSQLASWLDNWYGGVYVGLNNSNSMVSKGAVYQRNGHCVRCIENQ
jgi:uncharacterized protein (TIGR02145 family)